MSKVTVTMLRNPSKSFGCPLFEGQTGELDQTMADALEAAGLCVVTSRPKAKAPVVKAVPAAPEITGVEELPQAAASDLPQAEHPQESAAPAVTEKKKSK